MSEPVFLEVDQILKLHEKSLERFGGTSGVRDQGLLEGAVVQPRQDFYYAQADLCGIAAAYAFHIAEVQAFSDGNKRTAIAAALTFLEMQGYNTACDWKILYEAMIDLAQKRINKAELTKLFRKTFKTAEET